MKSNFTHPANCAKCLAITSSFTQQQLNGADFTARNLAEAPAQSLRWPGQ